MTENKKSKSKIKSWYSNRYQIVVVQRNILLLFTLVSMFSVAISIIFVKTIMSSKSLEPYVIEVEEKTGIATVVDQISARIVGEVMGKYHPHGDTAIYDTMVRLAQEWNMREPLIDGQGNFGSQDGDPPAAMRYTEVRMKKIAEAMMDDLDKETVDFQLNFDDSLKEPTVMPTKIPQLLVNGSSGIAVGMATNMMPHNLDEVIDGCIAYIGDREITIDELMKYVKYNKVAQ